MQEEYNENEKLNAKTLVSLVLNDIDIYLLKEKDQITDKKRKFTTEEVRAQLGATADKIVIAMKDLGLDIERPIPLSVTMFN